MRVGLNDLILEKQVELQKRVILKIQDILQGEKPFAMEKVDNKVVADAVDGLGILDMQTLVGEFGEDRINQLIRAVRKSQNRRQV